MEFEDFLTEIYTPLKSIELLSDIIYKKFNEDWDFKNKCDHNLDMVATDSNYINLFNNKDFSGKFIFKKNGGELVELNISFKYFNNFYYIDNIE